MALRVLVSAGEASGDMYAARLVSVIRARHPDTEFFGCTGPRMRAAGVRQVVDSASLAVVGLVEVIEHLPRIYGEFRKMRRAIASQKPDVGILTDSPDFHLRLAKQLKAAGVPVVYLIAPQVWAWRKGRLPAMRRLIDRLLCIFPFEEAFFTQAGIPASYIGHPLSRLIQPSLTRDEFIQRFALRADLPIVALLPGSRAGERKRHMPELLDGVERIARRQPANFVLGLPAGFEAKTHTADNFSERIQGSSIQVIEGHTWDLLAYADLALAASGTVTIEAALLGTPMVTFYKVSPWSWLLGRALVKVPFFSMVNLVANRSIVPELIQHDMTGERIAQEALRLLESPAASAGMRAGLADVSRQLASRDDPMETAASLIERYLEKDPVHAA